MRDQDRSGRPAPLEVSLLALAAVLGAARLGAEEPGRYRVDFAGGAPLTARLVSEEPGIYVLEVEGNVLRVPMEGVKRMERLDPPRNDGAPAGAAGKEAPRGEPRRPQPAASEDRSGDQEVRNAIERLAGPEGPALERAYLLLARRIADSRPLLHGALASEVAPVRLRAAKILGEYGSEKDDLEAVARLLADSQALVRRQAVLALRNLGPRSLPAMVRYLPGEENAGNRKAVVGTLRIWNDLRAVAPLVELLGTEKDAAVKLLAVSALEELTGESLGDDPPAWWAYLAEEKRRREAPRLLQAQRGAVR